MPLPLPNLDDRRWVDLIDEGRALIPRYAPGWTDFNVHDPGITAMELFAWLAEASIYQLNQIPPRHYWKFLSLIGYRHHGPRAARAVIVFEQLAAGTSIDVPAGVEFDARDANGRAIPFTTVRDTHLAPVSLSAVQVDNGDGALRSHSRDLSEGLPILALGAAPDVGAALYLGFDTVPSSVPVSLALWFSGPGNDARERDRIEDEAARQRNACRPVLPDIRCRGAKPPKVERAWLPPPHHSAQVDWEVFTGAAGMPWTVLQAVSMPAHPSTGQAVDDTRALTLDGIVEVNLPPTIIKTVLGEEPNALYYLRARLAAGAYDAPVVLTDVRANSVAARQHAAFTATLEIAAGVAVNGAPPALGDRACLRFSLSDGVLTSLAFIPGQPTGVPGFALLAYQPPTPIVAGSITIECSVPGAGSGAPFQVLALPAAPAEQSVAVHTHDGTHWTRWRRHDDFDAARRDSRVFTLDTAAGTITGGSGERGSAFPYGQAVVATGRFTSAAAGNVGGYSIYSLGSTPKNAVLLAGVSATDLAQLTKVAVNPHTAEGGRDDESLDEIVARAAGRLHAHQRIQDLADAHRQDTLDQIVKSEVLAIEAPTQAVNALDIERIALDVPGTRIARSRAWSDTSALLPCLDAQGVVTVVIVPDMPVPRPRPSEGLKSAVLRYLDLRRMICTRIEVAGPQYVTITVLAQVRAVNGSSRADTAMAIVAELNSFLDPRIGGPLGLGWPFGRWVYRAEVLEKIASVHGVDYVTGLRLVADSGQPQCGDIPVCANWLVAPGAHLIEVST
jgi:hypothetical protein